MARNLKNAERALKHRNRPSVSVQTCLTSKRPSLTSSSRLPILMSQNNTVSGSCRCVLAFNPTNPTITSMPPCCVCTAPSSLTRVRAREHTLTCPKTQMPGRTVTDAHSMHLCRLPQCCDYMIASTTTFANKETEKMLCVIPLRHTSAPPTQNVAN